MKVTYGTMVDIYNYSPLQQGKVLHMPRGAVKCHFVFHAFIPHYFKAKPVKLSSFIIAYLKAKRFFNLQLKTWPAQWDIDTAD